MVLLDHGLYKELPTDFRLDYCRLWKVCIYGDSFRRWTDCAVLC